MYAVVKTGGKQYRVSEGERLEVERLGEPDDKVELTPVLFVDGDTVLASRGDLDGVSVTATIVDEHRGPKVTGFTYKNTTNQRKRWGHRQQLSTIEITSVSKG